MTTAYLSSLLEAAIEEFQPSEESVPSILEEVLSEMDYPPDLLGRVCDDLSKRREKIAEVPSRSDGSAPID